MISIAREIFDHNQLKLTNDEVSFIEARYKKVYFQKGTIVLDVNQQIDYQYYVHDGCLRTYLISDSGKEHTIQFAIKGWWISDYIGYFLDQKSILCIECLEDAILYKISKEKAEEIFDNIPKTERFIRHKLERSFASFQKRILANLSLPAKKRYLNFIHDYPTIEKSVKNYHIASYLGITTESLSRIRKEIAHRIS
ncbi:Crp/Fnr family transcriptional regulator [Kordia zhangzhouensis]|uniref:Crp/Fnr family transcriptional regulator n=1 Tax=Kordia zhangzhouensis TaxID=1620405 RepID=UPI000AA3ADD0|nr:Crp/Fnr family transcriptional regulator [Kordia zhangzhouensis]